MTPRLVRSELADSSYGDSPLFRRPAVAVVERWLGQALVTLDEVLSPGRGTQTARLARAQLALALHRDLAWTHGQIGKALGRSRSQISYLIDGERTRQRMAKAAHAGSLWT